jgi:hypothetical protein
MSRFLNLCEEFDPTNSDPKWDLIKLFEKKGIKIELHPLNENGLIVTNKGKKINLTISSNEEDGEAQVDSIDQEVTNIAQDPTNILNPKAKQLTNKKKQQSQEVVKAAEIKSKKLNAAIQKTKRAPIIKTNY